MFFSTHFGTGQRSLWIKLVGGMLILLLLGAVLHVHPNGIDGTVCLVCVSAQTSSPTSVFLILVVLLAVASVHLASSELAPASAPASSSFIRPPPVL